MADIIAMFRRWANSRLSQMSSWESSSLDVPSSSSIEPTRRNAMKDFQRIMRMLPRIEAVLADAEEREILDRSVDLWLSELRLLAYDIDDVVDEYEYEVLRARVKAYHHGKLKRSDDGHHDILASSSSQVPAISGGMAEKLREIRERFDEIERDRKALRLREEDGVRRFVTPRRPRTTSSVVDESSIFGREGDKEKIMELLFSNMESGNNIRVSKKITVIPIVGMGGVGKTTLAQLIYNDPKIHCHFDLRTWIYVSEDFDLVRLTREIYRSVTNKCEENCGLDYLQDSIKKEVMKFGRMLLVLDDVWNEEQRLWESLKAPFQGACNVIVLMTTRNEKVADVMRTMKSFRLGFLSEEKGWQLFQQRALCDDENLMKIGQRIVRKCGGLPLAIRLLGSHLRFERDEYKWMSILESELWDLEPGTNEILPALRLSYQRMPIQLKPCFRYCSMFPKNSIPNKNNLVWLWMAQGYIQQKIPGKTTEEIGREYVDELLGRSLLQPTESNDYFEMHDLIFDLAVFISGKEFIRMNLEGGKANIFISNNARHLVVHDQRAYDKTLEGTLAYPFLSRHVALRSIFFYGQSINGDFQLLNSLHLRALHIDIYGYNSNMLKLLGSITSLKHLRYLYMRIARLGYYEKYRYLSFFNAFHSINLQVLDLFNCDNPIMLLGSISSLVNLRHLMLPYNSYMPCGISKLTSLQTLKYVIVMDESHECGGLSEIEDLESLTGGCRIINISDATDVEAVKKANLNGKKHIWKLNLDWSDNVKYNSGFSFDVDISFQNYFREVQSNEMVEAMLEALRPHNNLKELEIYGYPGIRFPLWLGNPSYSKLRDITLHGYNEWDGSCGVLDRDLPCLQSMSIINCAKLKNIKVVQSSSLRRLRVKNCFEITTLQGLRNLHGLEELNIKKCHNLFISVEERLPSKLRSVCFKDCWKLTSVTGLHNLHSLEKLKLIRCPKLQLHLDEQLSTIPGVVKVMDCPGLREFCQRYGFEFIQVLSLIEELNSRDLHDLESVFGSANFVSLNTLYIHNLNERKLRNDEWIPCSLNTLHLGSCRRLKFFPPYQNLSALRLLKIWRCKALKYLPGLQMMKSLENLEIIKCPQLTLSPVQRLPSKLQYLLISKCPSLRWLPGLQRILSLRDLKLYECRELMLLPLEQLPFLHKVQLEIIDCPKLGEWYRRYSVSYDNKEFPKALFARSNQQINLGLEEASIFNESICILDYDETILETEKWSAFRLLGFYICSCIHLKSIKFNGNFTKLKRLRIWNCPHLEVLYELYDLTSLQDMDISNCAKLHYLRPPKRLQSTYLDNIFKRHFVKLQIFFSSVHSLKISKCPKLCLDNESLPYPPPYVEIRACPQLQEWCQKNNIDYFQK